MQVRANDLSDLGINSDLICSTCVLVTLTFTESPQTQRRALMDILAVAAVTLVRAASAMDSESYGHNCRLGRQPLTDIGGISYDSCVLCAGLPTLLPRNTAPALSLDVEGQLAIYRLPGTRVFDSGVEGY